MFKNILIISASPRKNSNSEILAKAFAEGAKNAGNHVELVSLAGKIFAGGVTAPGEATGYPARQRAYELGASV